jgi:benzoyl-CoA reductase/2-hydroxyglutaryl-CoA dehydratase subunit BcrC/BadD/HgdB
MLMKPLLRFDSLLSVQARIGLEIMTSQSMTPEVMVATSPGMAVFRNYVKKALDCADNHERPLVWHAWCLCSDLILAFDAQPFRTEALSILPMPLGPKPVERLIDIAENSGVPVEYCSATKNALGAYLGGQLPEPACIVTVSHPCDSMLSSYQSMQYLTGIPTHMLDTPNWDDGRALDYYTDEVRKLIAFLEEHLDRKLDYDRLREVVTECNRTNELLMEINEMHRAVPCPGSGLPNMMAWFFRVLGMGAPEVTETTRRLHQVTRERLDAGRGSIRNEKIRVIWYDVPIVFYPLIIWMEETFGAVVAIDLLSYINTAPIDTSTPESMIRGLAEENMNLAMVRQFRGQLDLLTRDLSRVCEEYGGDCFIYAGHVGCKHG